MRRALRLLAVPSGVAYGALVCAALGIALLVVGLHLDRIAWWDGHAYAANMYSAFSGALIGLPISIVVIAVVLDQARDHRATARAHELARKAAGDMAFEALMLLGVVPGDTEGDGLAAVREVSAALAASPSRTAAAGSDARRWVLAHAPDRLLWELWLWGVKRADQALTGAVRFAETNGVLLRGADRVSAVHAAVERLCSPRSAPARQGEVLAGAAAAFTVYETAAALQAFLSDRRRSAGGSVTLADGRILRFEDVIATREEALRALRYRDEPPARRASGWYPHKPGPRAGSAR